MPRRRDESAREAFFPCFRLSNLRSFSLQSPTRPQDRPVRLSYAAGAIGTPVPRSAFRLGGHCFLEPYASRPACRTGSYRAMGPRSQRAAQGSQRKFVCQQAGALLPEPAGLTGVALWPIKFLVECRANFQSATLTIRHQWTPLFGPPVPGPNDVALYVREFVWLLPGERHRERHRRSKHCR